MKLVLLFFIENTTVTSYTERTVHCKWPIFPLVMCPVSVEELNLGYRILEEACLRDFLKS